MSWVDLVAWTAATLYVAVVLVVVLVVVVAAVGSAVAYWRDK